MVVMDKTKKVTLVRDVRHHANCLEKSRRQYEFTIFLDLYCLIDRHDQKIHASCAPSDSLVRKV